MKSVIKINNLVCQFGSTRAVNGISLEIEESSICALLGPNGAGKSSVIKSLMGLYPQYSGQIKTLSRDSKKLSTIELQNIGYVSEDQKLPGWMTVSNLMQYCKALYPSWDQEFNGSLIQQFDLPRSQKIAQLSRGMKMKAALIASISYRPKLLILDEPFSGLDPEVREEVIDGILSLTEQEQWTVLLTSHDLEEVERLADQIMIIKSGEVLMDEKVDPLQESFRSIQVNLKSPIPNKEEFPKNWLQPKSNSHFLEFIHKNTEGINLESEITNKFGEITSITSEAVGLREIYLAITKSKTPSAPALK